MNIRIRLVCLDQLFILRHMRQNPQFNLGIVRIGKQIALLRHEYLTYSSAKLHTHGNILQIRLCGTDPSGCRDRLIKCRVDSAVLCNTGEQPFRIGGF